MDAFLRRVIARAPKTACEIQAHDTGTLALNEPRSAVVEARLFPAMGFLYLEGNLPRRQLPHQSQE